MIYRQWNYWSVDWIAILYIILSADISIENILLIWLFTRYVQCFDETNNISGFLRVALQRIEWV